MSPRTSPGFGCRLGQIDAREDHGVLEQTKRHSFITSLLGIKHIVVAVNKMDLVDFSQQRFEEIHSEYKEFSARLDQPDLHFIPISALEVSASDIRARLREKTSTRYLLPESIREAVTGSGVYA